MNSLKKSLVQKISIVLLMKYMVVWMVMLVKELTWLLKYMI